MPLSSSSTSNFEYSTTNIPAFLSKLWTLVEDSKYDELIAWDQSGFSFHVFDQTRFAREILPRFFKHNNMASFIRQLNMYGFRKVNSIDHGSLKNEKEDMEFHHPYFIKGKEQFLEFIKRKVPDMKQQQQQQQQQQASNQLVSPGASGMINGHLIDQNGQLSLQYSPIKSDELNRVLDDVNIIKSKQKIVDDSLFNVKKENEALWKEIALLRQKHHHQQQIVNKLIHFLVHLVNPSSLGMKRSRPLMIDSHSDVTLSNLDGDDIEADINNIDEDDVEEYIITSNGSTTTTSSSNNNLNKSGNSLNNSFLRNKLRRTIVEINNDDDQDDNKNIQINRNGENSDSETSSSRSSTTSSSKDEDGADDELLTNESMRRLARQSLISKNNQRQRISSVQQNEFETEIETINNNKNKNLLKNESQQVDTEPQPSPKRIKLVNNSPPLINVSTSNQQAVKPTTNSNNNNNNNNNSIYLYQTTQPDLKMMNSSVSAPVVGAVSVNSGTSVVQKPTQQYQFNGDQLQKKSDLLKSSSLTTSSSPFTQIIENGTPTNNNNEQGFIDGNLFLNTNSVIMVPQQHNNHESAPIITTPESPLSANGIQNDLQNNSARSNASISLNGNTNSNVNIIDVTPNDALAVNNYKRTISSSNQMNDHVESLELDLNSIKEFLSQTNFNPMDTYTINNIFSPNTYDTMDNDTFYLEGPLNLNTDLSLPAASPLNAFNSNRSILNTDPSSVGLNSPKIHNQTSILNNYTIPSSTAKSQATLVPANTTTQSTANNNGKIIGNELIQYEPLNLGEIFQIDELFNSSKAGSSIKIEPGQGSRPIISSVTSPEQTGIDFLSTRNDLFQIKP